MSSRKPHLLLLDDHTLETLNMALEFFANPDVELEATPTVASIRTLQENLRTGVFRPEQGEVLQLYHQPELMHYAEQVHTDDDLEVDDMPIFSETENGCWVNAWVFIPNADEDDDDVTAEG